MRMREWSARFTRPKLVRCASGPLGLNWSAMVRYGLQKKYLCRRHCVFMSALNSRNFASFLTLKWLFLGVHNLH